MINALDPSGGFSEGGEILKIAPQQTQALRCQMGFEPPFTT